MLGGFSTFETEAETDPVRGGLFFSGCWHKCGEIRSLGDREQQMQVGGDKREMKVSFPKMEYPRRVL